MANLPIAPVLPIILRGKYWSGAIQVYNVKPTKLDVSGYTWTGRLSATPGGASVQALTVDVTSAATGLVGFSIEAADTTNLTQSTLWLGIDVTIGGKPTQAVRASLRIEDPA